MKLSFSVKMSIALGIIQILEYSGFNMQLLLMFKLAKVAILFMLIGINLPKEKTN